MRRQNISQKISPGSDSLAAARLAVAAQVERETSRAELRAECFGQIKHSGLITLPAVQQQDSDRMRKTLRLKEMPS